MPRARERGTRHRHSSGTKWSKSLLALAIHLFGSPQLSMISSQFAVSMRCRIAPYSPSLFWSFVMDMP